MNENRGEMTKNQEKRPKKSLFSQGAEWLLYFEDDYNWLVDIMSEFDVNNIVAHNTNFDLKFLPSEVKAKIQNQEYSTFCTMQQNRDITPNNKAPKLIEACNIYNIDFDESDAHSSDYDTLKCFEVFTKTMLKRAEFEGSVATLKAY